jgi:predicted transcriptional regulator
MPIEDQGLSRRERQIIDCLHAMGEGTVAHVRSEMENAPGYDAVRTTLRILEDKGQVTHRRVGRTYVYRPLRSRAEASTTAVSRLVNVFFGGSAGQAAIAVLKQSDFDLSSDDLRELEEMLKAAEEGNT